jgi:uroporphyrin-III C-methyltransferase / precorrin-2 dehydrogenase / sirohydrochlorin ferrochelatase
MPLFPVFVKLEGRRVLLVGAGPVGEGKVSGLLAAGAAVTVVAPRATPAISELATSGRLQWHQRTFRPDDLDDVALVVAAVPKDVASAIHREARTRGVLCNSVDDVDNCDFYYPAVVTRGDLQIAISTGGHSPALAQRLRIQLEHQFGPEYAEWIRQLGQTRRELFAAEMDAEDRKRQLHALAEDVPTSNESRSGNPGLQTGHVYLVGAGPGDPELLTLKALRILGQADVVLHDDLLTPEILELIPSTARVECVGKRHGERQITQEEINRRLCHYACAGETVVRLKGGDGAIFGRASEEMNALEEKGVPYSIVPGVTAASGAAAAAGVSLTDRRISSALVFLTAQRCKGNPPPNWRAVADLGGTAAIYMPGGHEADVARELIGSGMAPTTPCFVVANATRPDQQVIETTLKEMTDLPRLAAPALLLIGAIAPGVGAPAPVKKARKQTESY